MRDAKRQKKLALLERYVARHGWRKFVATAGGTTYRGVDLGSWVNNLRQAAKRDRVPAWLTSRLEAIPGWAWDPRLARVERRLALLREFVASHGMAALGVDTECDGERIGKWVEGLRHRHRNQEIAAWLQAELEAIPGWTWDPRTARHHAHLAALRKWLRRNSWEAFRVSTERDGLRVGRWVDGVRQRYKDGSLGDWLIAELETIPGWSWDPIGDRQRELLAEVQAFVRKFGFDALTPDTTVDGLRLGAWVTKARARRSSGTLPVWIRDGLETLPGWSWTPREDNVREKLRLLVEFVAEHGWHRFRPGSDAIVVDDIDLSRWLSGVRNDYTRDNVSPWLVDALERIEGWTWTFRDDYHDQFFDRLYALIDEHDEHERDVLRDVVKLATWIDLMRDQYADDEIDPETAKELERIPGWRWARPVRGTDELGE